MRKLRRLLVSGAILTLLCGLVMSASAGAEVSSGDTATTDGGTSQNSGTETNHSGSSGSSSGDIKKGSDLAQQFQQMAQEKVQQAKENHKAQTEAQRQKVCEVRKANLTKRMARAVTVANQHKANIDRIYTKVKDFVTNKQLTVTDYDQLTSKVDTAQSAAADSISALTALDVNVDCSSQTVADSVASFREAVSNTRDSLKAYRQALIDLITSIKGTSSSNSSTDSTNDSGQ